MAAAWNQGQVVETVAGGVAAVAVGGTPPDPSEELVA